MTVFLDTIHPEPDWRKKEALDTSAMASDTYVERYRQYLEDPKASSDVTMRLAHSVFGDETARATVEACLYSRHDYATVAGHFNFDPEVILLFSKIFYDVEALTGDYWDDKLVHMAPPGQNREKKWWAFILGAEWVPKIFRKRLSRTVSDSEILQLYRAVIIDLTIKCQDLLRMDFDAKGFSNAMKTLDKISVFIKDLLEKNRDSEEKVLDILREQLESVESNVITLDQLEGEIAKDE